MRMHIETQFKLGEIVYCIVNNEIKLCAIFEIIVKEYVFQGIKIFYNVRDIHEQEKTYIIEERYSAMNEEYLQEIIKEGSGT